MTICRKCGCEIDEMEGVCPGCFKEPPVGSSECVRRLHSVAGNPWTDQGGNFRVECPQCWKRMKHIGHKLYQCGVCGQKWELQS